MATRYTPRIVTDGLILCLDAANTKSYPGTGTAWSDLTKNGNNGTLTNGPTFSTSNGGSISLDGTNDYIDVTTNLGTLGNYTIMFWARRDANDRMPIAYRGGTQFYWYGDNSWRYTHGGIGAEYYYSKPTSIPLGTWGNYCVVYDGLRVIIYRQGIYQGEQASTGTADWTSGMWIGWWVALGPYAWQGLISNVLMYNTALTQSQVTQNFNATKSRYGL